MSKIDDLKESISTMSDEALQALLLDIRLSRRTPKKVDKPSKAKASTPASSNQLDADTLLASLTPEMRATLLRKMEGK